MVAVRRALFKEKPDAPPSRTWIRPALRVDLKVSPGSGSVMRAQLMPLDGGSPVELVKELTVVGRKEDCDLRLEHKSVSKMHCVIVKTDGLLFLRDLGSTNGTRVNGTRVRRAALLPNDQLSIANYKYRVQLGPDEPSVQPHEHTQQMDAKEVADLLKKAKAEKSLEDSEELPPQEQVKANPLPDVYPDDGKG
jgi:pSer/pThr/pTyr-binding forkhead associated (FHA) protein